MKNDARIRSEVNKLGIPPKDMLKREIARLERRESYYKLIGRMIFSFVVVAAVIVLVTNLFVAVLEIEGSSMNPLLKADEIVVTTRGGNPGRNDVIAFTHNNRAHVKRVIAVAGDMVVISENGAVTVNGVALDEPYVTEQHKGYCDLEFPYQVPPEAYFVLGDNRESSMDSRNSDFGPVHREQIIGFVKFRIWPLSKTGGVS